MTKLLLVGDVHGNKGHMKQVFQHALNVGTDLIIQLGDFGYAFDLKQFKGTGGKIECDFSHYVSKLSQESGIPVKWLGGNHENYDHLEQTIEELTPSEDGTVEYMPGVSYIPRGTRLEFDGVSFLVCGGAASVDKKRRRPYISWWPQELITEADIVKCAEAGEVDILLTHDFPWEVSVVDRHLDPYWGEEAQRTTLRGRQAVSAILAECNARYVWHGHLHYSYSQVVRVGHHPVKVIGLDRDTKPMHDNTYLLNTEQFKSTLSVNNWYEQNVSG